MYIHFGLTNTLSLFVSITVFAHGHSKMREPQNSVNVL